MKKLVKKKTTRKERRQFLWKILERNLLEQQRSVAQLIRVVAELNLTKFENK